MNNSKPKKKPRKEWTGAECEFDDIMTEMESLDQLRRMEGRRKWARFKDRFTEAQLDAMAIAIEDSAC